MANVLKKLVIDECSLVDKAANPGAEVVIMKRDSDVEPMTPTSAYQTLMKRARGMADRVAKSGAGPRLSVEQCFVKVLTDPANVELAKLSIKAGSAPLPVREAAPAPLSPAYEKLMSMAKRAADRDPSRTIHQHFALLATDPANRELFKAAKAPPKQGKANVDPEDEDDLDAEADLDPEDDDPDDANIGPGPDCDAVSHGDRADDYLRPRAYDRSGANVATNSAPAVVGRPEGSYDPTRRPASVRRQPPAWVESGTAKALRKVYCAAERASLSGKEASRYEKFLKRSPRGNHNDAMWYARATKEQRRAYRAARTAAA